MDAANYGEQQILADEVARDRVGSFDLTCPRCGGPVFFKGTTEGEVRPHFAHYAGGACLVGDKDYDAESRDHRAVRRAVHKRIRALLCEMEARVRMETRVQHERGGGVRICDVTARWHGQTYSYEVQESSPDIDRWRRWMRLLADADIQPQWILLAGEAVTRCARGGEVRYGVKGYATEIARQCGRLLLATVDKKGHSHLEEIPVAEAFIGSTGRVEPRSKKNGAPSGYFYLSLREGDVRKAAVKDIGLASDDSWGAQKGQLIIGEEDSLRRLQMLMRRGWEQETEDTPQSEERKPHSEDSELGREGATERVRARVGERSELSEDSPKKEERKAHGSSEALTGDVNKAEGAQKGESAEERRTRIDFDALAYIADTLHEGATRLRADADWSTKRLWSCTAIEQGVRRWSVDLWTPLVGMKTPLWWIFGIDPRAWQMIGYCTHFYYNYAAAYRERAGIDAWSWGGAKTGYVIRSLRESGLYDDGRGGRLFRKSLRRMGHWVDDDGAWVTRGQLMHLAVGAWLERMRRIGFLRATREMKASTEPLVKMGNLLQRIRHRGEGRAWTGEEKGQAINGVRDAYRELARELKHVERNSYFAPEIFHPPFMKPEEHEAVRRHIDHGLVFERNEIISNATGEILRSETLRSETPGDEPPHAEGKDEQVA